MNRRGRRARGNCTGCGEPKPLTSDGNVFLHRLYNPRIHLIEACKGSRRPPA